jgi:hypothetical protein
LEGRRYRRRRHYHIDPLKQLVELLSYDTADLHSPVDGGNYRALTVDDESPLHPDTLATWAAAVGQPDGVWQVDGATGGRVARLEWATEGEARCEGSRVTWIGQGR